MLDETLRGTFETATSPAVASELLFCVTTCQAYYDRDHVDGHNIYPSMLGLRPKFVAFTGDNVYYDSEQPQAVNHDSARHHWQRMHSLPRQIELMDATCLAIGRGRPRHLGRRFVARVCILVK